MLFKEIAIILAIYFMGETIVYLLDTRFPGGVVGMLLLLLSLHLKWVKINDIRLVSSFLLSYRPLFFIPASVSVMVTYTLMEGFYLQIVVITMVSTILVMALTAFVVQHFVQIGKL